MKKLITSSVAGVLLLSGSAMADSIFGDTTPYLGLEYKHMWMQGKGDWGEIVPDKFHNYGFIFGLRCYDSMGIEIGYNQSTKKAGAKYYANAITNSLGSISSGTELKTKVKMQNIYVDYNGYIEMSNKWDFVAIVGLGWAKAKISNDGSHPGGVGTAVETVQNAKTRARIVPRAGVGFEYIGPKWKMRAKVLWENTNRLHLKNVDKSIKNYYKDSIGFGVSVVYYII